MKLSQMLYAMVLLGYISSCAPAPTPYTSNVDPCDPDILTAIASSGGISRCDKIPTEQSQTVIKNIDKERDLQVVSFLDGLVSDPRYDPSQQVLAKYINNIEVDVENDALHFNINLIPDNAEDAISLAAELLFAGALVSHAGESSDWRLGIIDVNYPENLDSCGVSLYVNNESELMQIAQGQVNVYDVMESFVCELNETIPDSSSTSNLILCSDTYNMVGDTVECKIPRAYCTYQPTTSGAPTFCNDAPYPNHSFTTLIWGEDWSDYDGECIIVNGVVSMYQGKPQIEAFGRSQISSCP